MNKKSEKKLEELAEKGKKRVDIICSFKRESPKLGESYGDNYRYKMHPPNSNKRMHD